MKVAFIGLGSMGRPQARLLARARHALAVFDGYPAAMTPFEGMARLASSAADAATGVEVACVCVRDDQQVEEAVFGPRGLVEGLAEGALLVVHSTVRVETLRSLEKRLAGRGIGVVDGTVTRTRPTDDEPFVLTMLGGEPAQRKRARELAEAYSTEIEEVGPLGSAAALKIANNLVSWVHIFVGSLAAQVARHNGVPHASLERVMRANGNLTPTVGGLLSGFERNARGANAEYEAFLASQAGIGEKDLALAIESLSAAGLDPEVVEGVQRRIRGTMTRAGA
ncbi:NAD(P)-dependent oxidoreductase [Myxococcota bacterium]|nr:NAD(P)-dependent oxidoreductase [Myxococcota bacterium]